MLKKETVSIVKATVPALRDYGETITTLFYQIMFRDYPEVKAYFNQAHQAQGIQPRALANSVLAYAENIDNLQAMEDELPRIIQKHVALDIRAEHYPIVGKCLLRAIRNVLGDAATESVMNAWGEAYNHLAGLLIAAEEAIYEERESAPGGWRGPRGFQVIDKVRESDVITSFYLKPTDGEKIMDFHPGQFITVLLSVNDQPLRRTYSLSSSPGADYYRISVKREPDGVASNYLHDRVEIGTELNLLPPSGEFRLTDSPRPLVLLTAGVGITPAISMLDAAARGGRKIHFIHCALNSGVHAFREHVDILATRNRNINPHYIYSEPLHGDEADAEGLIDSEKLERLLPENRDVDLYFLGPKPFILSVWSIASDLQIPERQIHYEFFGPQEALKAS